MTNTTLTSDRITLRLINPTDLGSIHKLHSLPETDEFNTLGIPENIQETQATIQGWIAENNVSDIKNYTFAIEDNQTKKFIGLFGLKLSSKKTQRGEIWYKIHSDYWRKGFATESTNLVLDYGFDTLNLHRIQAGCAVDNIGSIKVLEKVGMIREGRGRQLLPLKSGWSDNFEYSILETDPRKK
jgi:ribosomal-protein-alanine N-acetyltransferase